MEKISERQREFARCIALGKKQVEAYEKVYGCEGKSPGAIRASASRLVKNKEIAKLINEYRAKAKRPSIMPLERRLALLYEQMEELEEDETMGMLFKTIDLINRMEGTYEMQNLKVKKAQLEAEEKRKAEGEVPCIPLNEGLRDEIIKRSEMKARAIALAQAKNREEELGLLPTTAQGEGAPHGQAQSPPDEGVPPRREAEKKGNRRKDGRG